MTDSRINLKQPVVAGILAFLIPGGGHLYQGRLFKAGIYCVCILGLFFSGMAMADWKAVQPPPKPNPPKISLLKYSAQLAVGLPAMYGLIQRERYYSEANQEPEQFTAPFTAPFQGQIELRDDSAIFEEVEGTIHFEPIVDSYGDLTLTGRLVTTIGGESRELNLGHHIRLGKRIKASEYRNVEASIIQDPQNPYESIGNLGGVIPRPFLNWYQAPMEEEEVQELHRSLGKYHELAMVFTWVAGLLNILAIWDAVEGPAYGFGDEQEQDDASSPEA